MLNRSLRPNLPPSLPPSLPLSTPSLPTSSLSLHPPLILSLPPSPSTHPHLALVTFSPPSPPISYSSYQVKFIIKIPYVRNALFMYYLDSAECTIFIFTALWGNSRNSHYLFPNS